MQNSINADGSKTISQDEIYESLCERHTKALQDKLLSGRVAIAGLGGLGSMIAVSLARAGVGHLHLIDFDRVDISNLHRQQYRIQDVGRFKTESLRDIIKEINPYLDIQIDTVKLNESNSKEIFTEDDIICEAFDSPEMKAMFTDVFFEKFSSEKILIAGSGMAGYGDSNLIRTRKINDNFYLCGDEIHGIEEGKSLMAPRVGICACHQANIVIHLLAISEVSNR